MCINKSKLKRYIILFEYECGYADQVKLITIEEKDAKSAYAKFRTDYARACFDPFKYRNCKARIFCNDESDENVFDEISDIEFNLGI